MLSIISFFLKTLFKLVVHCCSAAFPYGTLQSVLNWPAIPMSTSGKSPFPFLDNENQGVIDAVHNLIRSQFTIPEKRDQCIVILLSDENKERYSEYKRQRGGFPSQLGCLPDYHKFLKWFNTNCQLLIQEDSIEELMEFSRQRLEMFDLCQGNRQYTHLEKTIPNDLETVTANLQDLPNHPPSKLVHSLTQNCPQTEQQPNTENLSLLGQSPNSLQAHEANQTQVNTLKYNHHLSLGDWSPTDSERTDAKHRLNTSDSTPNGHDGRRSYDSPQVVQQISEPAEPDNSLNVLITGETGVGKTTFINAFHNCLTYGSLDEALRGEPIVKIRTSFSVALEENTKPVDIKIDASSTKKEQDNEPFDVEKGQSRTQSAMIYNFPCIINGKETNVRLVDTPGVLDTRGDEKDRENYYKTVETIKGLKHIHSLCVLLKPNEARLSSELTHALDLLLTYLPRTAVKHIVFCFTSTEPFDFSPAQSLSTVENYLNNLEKRTNIQLPIIKENIFCFDNNCFRFQCTVRVYPQHAEKRWKYEKCWTNNTNELKRMLEYVQLQIPYSIADIINIARVERRLLSFMDAFVEVVREHTREVVFLKSKEKSWFKNEIDERKECFKYILKCFANFSVFLQRNSVGIVDPVKINLGKLIHDMKQYSNGYENNVSMVKELNKIDVDYQTILTEKINKYWKRNNLTLEEIQSVLDKLPQLKYYGPKFIVTTGTSVATPSASFRNPHS